MSEDKTAQAKSERAEKIAKAINAAKDGNVSQLEASIGKEAKETIFNKAEKIQALLALGSDFPALASQKLSTLDYLLLAILAKLQAKAKAKANSSKGKAAIKKDSWQSFFSLLSDYFEGGECEEEGIWHKDSYSFFFPNFRAHQKQMERTRSMSSVTALGYPADYNPSTTMSNGEKCFEAGFVSSYGLTGVGPVPYKAVHIKTRARGYGERVIGKIANCHGRFYPGAGKFENEHILDYWIKFTMLDSVDMLLKFAYRFQHKNQSPCADFSKLVSANFFKADKQLPFSYKASAEEIAPYLKAEQAKIQEAIDTDKTLAYRGRSVSFAGMLDNSSYRSSIEKSLKA